MKIINYLLGLFTSPDFKTREVEHDEYKPPMSLKVIDGERNTYYFGSQCSCSKVLGITQSEISKGLRQSHVVRLGEYIITKA